MQVSTKGTFGHFGCGFTVYQDLCPRTVLIQCVGESPLHNLQRLQLSVRHTAVCVGSDIT